MKKKKTFILLIIIYLPFVFYSCKKGAEDPFFSFKPRKLRLVGEWHLFEGVYKSGGNIVNYSNDQALNGSDVWTYSENIKFNGNGTYECIVESEKFYEKIVKKGTWAFGARDKAADLKAKEYVIIRVEEISYYVMTNNGELEMHKVYTQDGCPLESLRLKELRSDEIIIDMESTIQCSYGNNDSSYVASFTKFFERTN